MQDNDRLIPFPTERHSRPRRLSLIAFLITEMIHQSSQFIMRQIHRNRLYPFYQFFNLSHLQPFQCCCNCFSVAVLLYLRNFKKSRDFSIFSRKSKLPRVHVSGAGDGDAPKGPLRRPIINCRISNKHLLDLKMPLPCIR